MKDLQVKPGQKIRLEDYDPDDARLGPGGKAKTNEKSDRLVERLGELQERLYAEGKRKLLVILQGMDTSGKDGTIRHVMRGVSPQSVSAVAFKQPSAAELAHDFLWRVHAEAPAAGEIAIFNRSHYEDVLVPRVHGTIDEHEWRRRYRQITEFESLLTASGTTIVKVFLHISRDEQRARLEERLQRPDKRWKLQPSDIAERRYWDDYQRAYADAIAETSTDHAPWRVVPANHKWYRDWAVSTILVGVLDGMAPRYPEPKDLGNLAVT